MNSGKERLIDEAKRLLQSMPSFEGWRQGLSEGMARAMTKLDGSPELFYQRLRAEIEKQIRDPAPTSVSQRPGEPAVFGWD